MTDIVLTFSLFYFIVISIAFLLTGYTFASLTITSHSGESWDKKVNYTKGPFYWHILFTKNPVYPRLKKAILDFITLDFNGKIWSFIFWSIEIVRILVNFINIENVAKSLTWLGGFLIIKKKAKPHAKHH